MYIEPPSCHTDVDQQTVTFEQQTWLNDQSVLTKCPHVATGATCDVKSPSMHVGKVERLGGTYIV